MVSVSRKVATCTISTIQDKLSKEEINVSVGTTLSLRPFFISFATEKEMALCLCKICLNAKLLFEPLIMQAKKDQYDVTESISEFFMYNCNCPKSENGYYKWKCVSGSCSDCKSTKPQHFQCASSENKVKISQFEVTETPYKRTVDGKTMDKI